MTETVKKTEKKKTAKKETAIKENAAEPQPMLGTDLADKVETPEQKAERVAACEKEMKQVLIKYNCDLTAQFIINENGNRPQVFIKPL